MNNEIELVCEPVIMTAELENIFEKIYSEINFDDLIIVQFGEAPDYE